jgi:hypothetical protein
VDVGFLLILANIGLIPVFIFFDGAIAQACGIALSAAALAAVAVRMQPKDIDRRRSVLLGATITGLFPALWMFVQALPLGGFGIRHPIWSSTSAALGVPLSSSLSVDPGATLIALGQYTGCIALGLATSIVTIDRRKAERILFALLAITTAISILVIVRINVVIDASRPSSESGVLVFIPSVLAIGCVIAVTTAIRAYERRETRTQDPRRLVLSEAAPRMMIGIVPFFLCGVALIRVGQDYILAATAIALGIFAALALIRRLGFGGWGMAAIGIVLTAIAFAVFAESGMTRSSDPLLAFVDPGTVMGTGLAGRLLADLRWSGSGAGTIAELIQLYGNIDGTSANNVHLSAVAIIAIEVGRSALVLIAIGVMILEFILLRATIKRGRDSFFPGAGVASIAILSIGAFGDSAALTIVLGTLMSVIVGLALAQSAGRSTER